jgi:hypothetical protein
MTVQRAGSRVFLCHASADKAEVRKLHHRLVGDDYNPWFDEEDLIPGQDWELAIRQAVGEADFVVVCLSKASTTSAGYVHKEIMIVLDVADRQPPDSIFVIPARLEECELPQRLERWHCVNLFTSGGYSRLARALSSKTGVPPPSQVEVSSEPLGITDRSATSQPEDSSSIASPDDPGNSSAVARLIGMLSDGDSSVRYEAMSALDDGSQRRCCP